MPRPKTHKERTLIIAWIIEMVKKHGRATTKDIAAMFGLLRSSAEKYMQVVIKLGHPIRHVHRGIFHEQHAVNAFDM